MFAFNLFLGIHCKNVPIWKLVENVINMIQFWCFLKQNNNIFYLIYFFNCFIIVRINFHWLIAYNCLLFQNSIIYYFSEKNRYRLNYFKINAKLTVTKLAYLPPKMGVRTSVFIYLFLPRSFNNNINNNVTIWTLDFFYSLLHKTAF